MLKIGDFSRLSQVSVKALRYYDEVGLLRPARVDRETGYRYYAAEQLPRLHRILALKELGFPLEQVACLLDDALPPERLRGMLLLRQAEAQQRLSTEQARLSRVETLLRQIEQEHAMPNYDVVVKKIDPVRVASIREVVPAYSHVGRLFDELCPWLLQQKVPFAGPAIAVYYDPEYRERDVDVEVAVPVAGEVPAHPRVTVRELPAVAQAATVIHHGPYETLSEAYQALLAWVQANGYQISGPNREVYLQCQDTTGGTPADNVTEIQLPVTPA